MIEDILSKLGAGGYTPTYESPEDIVKRVVSFQKSQRAGPVTGQLQEAGQGYSQATPEVQTQKRARANALRAAYVTNGGNPADLDPKLHGSDPNRGFQIGEGKFHVPEYNVEDNMTNAQKERRAGITGLFEGKPTYDRQARDADLTGMYQGKETPAYQLIKAQLEQAKTGGASDMSEWLTKLGITQEISDRGTNIKSKQDAAKAAVDYVNGLSEEKDKFGVITKDGLNKNDQRMINEEVADMVSDQDFDGDYITSRAKGIISSHPKLGPIIINALRTAAAQLINLGK